MSAEVIEKPAASFLDLEFDETPFPRLANLRRRAWDLAVSLGLPTTKDEEWKYTDLRGIGPLRKAAAAEPEACAVEAASFPDMDAWRVVFVDGRWSRELSSPIDEPGLEVGPLADAGDGLAGVGTIARLEAERFPVTAHLGVLKKDPVHALAALNTATFVDGTAVRVRRNSVLSKPIHLIFVATGGYSAPRLLVEIEEGAQAKLVETYISLGDAEAVTNAVAEVSVGPNAHLEHVKVQAQSLASRHVALTEARQQADSTYLHFNVGFGAMLARNDVNVFLDGSNLHCRLDGVVALDGDQHHDNHTRLDHAKPFCDSFEVYKHVLDGSSTAVFNGKIFVHQDAQKTDAKQTNQTLLLSPTATIDTKPQLEIFADDVKCTHGATVGRVRDDAMFYLRARGVPEAQARALLVYAFAAEVLEKISIEPLRVALEATLFEKLGTGGG